MVMITNAAARPIFTGIKDTTNRKLPVTREQYPQHLALFYIMAKRGKLNATLTSGTEMLRMYGADTFNERSKYFSHQTMGVNRAAEYSSVFIKRLIAPNAKRATMVLWFEVVEDLVPQYARNSDGSVIRDTNGVMTYASPAVDVDGHRCRWVISESTDPENIKLESPKQGTLTNANGDTSMMYPILAYSLEHGDFGNNVGVRFSYPAGPTVSDPTDISVITEQLSSIYRVQFVERATTTSSPNIIYTLASEPYVDFALKNGVVNPKTNLELAPSRIVDEYEYRDSSGGYIPKYAPIEKYHIFESHVTTVTEMLYAKESLSAFPDPTDPPVSTPDMMNLFTLTDYLGNPHYTVVMDGTSEAINSNTTHYARGGADGDVGVDVLNDLVIAECGPNWGTDPKDPLLDRARYPFSCLYDTGFSNEAKKAILSIIGKRVDVYVTACTQDILAEPYDSEADAAATMFLRSFVQIIPESVIHGTSVCRAAIIGQTAYQSGSTYKAPVPIILDLITKRARYMGAGDGRYKSEFAYDVSPNNRLESMYDVSHPYKSDLARSRDWEIGLNWVQYGDRSTPFYPTIQTVANDDTSVLNNDINVAILVDITKKADLVWAEMTGNGKLTRSAFREACRQKMLEKVSGLYDGRCSVDVNVYFTAADEARGYSWTMDTLVTMNNVPTVATINIISQRNEDQLTGV